MLKIICGGTMIYNKIELNNLVSEIQRLGYLQEGPLDFDSFTDLRYIYQIRIDNTYAVTLEIRNHHSQIDLINRHEQETYTIKYSVLTHEIIEATRNTSDGYGMSYEFDPDKIIEMIQAHMSELDEQEMYKSKMINTLKIALDRIIPDHLTNGYTGARFRISHLKMNESERKIFEEETDAYREVRNAWELKELHRKVEYWGENKKLLQFIPSLKILNTMGYNSLEQLKLDLELSNYFIEKSDKLSKVLKYKIELLIENEKLFLKTLK